jgi:hypothetical protein
MRTRRLDFYVGWQVPSTEAYIQWETLSGDSGTLLIPGPTIINRALPLPDVQYPIDIVYGDSIRLRGVSFSATELNAGDEIVVQLVWGFEDRMDVDWDTVIRLVDGEGNVAAELNEYPAAYPTTAWRPSPDFGDIRRLVIPENTPSGDYRFEVGWIDDEGEFLPFRTDNGEMQRLYEIQVPIAIR